VTARTISKVRWLFAAGAAIVAGVAAASLAVRCGGAAFLANNGGNAVVQLQRTRHDFGTVRQGPILETAFTLRNAGSRRLIVRQLKGSCECLSGAAKEIVLQPGEAASLKVQLDTQNATGPMAVELNYLTSDPACPTFKLVVSADIKPQQK
jgi:Protein of unknown function (DUF1573)